MYMTVQRQMERMLYGVQYSTVIIYSFQTIRTCNCDSPLCNRNWEEAGYTPNPASTDHPTQPAGDTVQVGDDGDPDHYHEDYYDDDN